MTQAVDAAVIGSGPAGSTAARLLTLWGHSTVVVTRRAARRSLAESIPPSTRKLLGYLGVLRQVDAAGFYRTSGNTVWWGNAPRRVERFSAAADGRGYQVLRSRLDRLLLDLAAEAGARIVSGATVRSVDLRDRGARLEYETERGARASLRARFVLDCSGRAGVLARQGPRIREAACATLAIAGVWQRKSWSLEDPSHTLIASYDRGWAWSIPVSSRSRHFTVMIDASGHPSARDGGLTAKYLGELARVGPFAAVLDGAALEGAPWGCDASVYSARRFAGRRFLLVGDAGSSIDPLSSFGVKKALASAWVAAVAVHTCLEKPRMREAALDFFDARERMTYSTCLKQASQFYREAAEAHPHRFWTARAGLRLDPGVREADEEEFKSDPKVLPALDALKAARSIRLERAPDVRIERRAAIAGREIALQDTVVAPAIPSGLRFLGGVNLPRLVELAPGHRQVPDLFDAYNRSAAPVDLPSFLGALSVLLAKGILTTL